MRERVGDSRLRSLYRIAISVSLAALLVWSLNPITAHSAESDAMPSENDIVLAEGVAPEGEGQEGDGASAPDTTEDPSSSDPSNEEGERVPEPSQPDEDSPEPDDPPQVIEIKKPVVMCETYKAGASSWDKASQGKAGKSSGSKALTAVRFSYEGQDAGSLKYATYIKGKGWSNYVSSRAASGSKKASQPLQALRIKLTGAVAKKYHVYYRVNLVGYGWTDWAKNGKACGAANLASLRAVQVKVVKKGDKAPGATENIYFVKGKSSADKFYAKGGLTRTELIKALNKASGTGLKTFGGSYDLNSKAGKNLKRAIAALSGYRLSFVMMDLTTGQGISYSPNLVQYSASSIKGPYVAAINKYYPGSVTVGVRSTMSETIKVSSNSGYSSLRSRFGHGAMANMMKYSGISENEMTAYRNYVYLSSRTLAKLWVGTYWSYYRDTNALSSWARNLYAHPLNSFISQALSTTTCSKPGWYPGGGYNVQNDAGVVLAKDHHYVVSVMSSACGQYTKLRSLVKAIDGVHQDMVK